MSHQSPEYTTISLPLAQRINHGDGDRDLETPKSSPTLMADSIMVRHTSISSDQNVTPDDCVNPAKSVLRPRAGKEYVILRRVPLSDSACCLPSAGLPANSPSLSQVFRYELTPDHCSRHSPDPKDCRHCKARHRHLHHPVSSCTSLSLCSHPSVPRSPSFTSTIGTTRSHISLVHEPSDKESRLKCPYSHAQKSPAQTSSTAPSSPSSSSNAYSSHNTIHPSPNPRTFSPLSAVTNQENIFFPIDINYHASSPISRTPSSVESQPIYVNQQFVDMHYSLNNTRNSCNRTASTCSSHSTSSPFHNTRHSLRKGSIPNSATTTNSGESGSLGRRAKSRSRHSESDAFCMRTNKHSNSFSLPSNHHLRPCLTLPASVQRSHSDPKRAEKFAQRDKEHQSNVHGKEFDKFANSSIIARRRLKHTESMSRSSHAENGESPPGPSMSTSDPSLSLRVPSGRSSGYKNLDRFCDSPHCSASASIFPIAPAPHLENIVESQATGGHHHHHHQTNSSHSDRYASNSPPPLPLRQRLVSTPSSDSPPLTPYLASSDISDSPPPYNAPPPPLSCYSESVATSSSSEEDQELNYIEVDMSTVPLESRQPALPISFSRQSKRARQQRKLAKLRYAEIDHTATKALEHTGQEHAQTRRGGILSKSGSSLSRINSAPMSKSRKPMAVRERKHSTGSLESF